MNPLSTWTYHRRHKRHAALLLGLSLVVTVGLYAVVALVWGVFVEPPRLAYRALSKFSVVTPPSAARTPDPAVLATLRANPDVARIMPATLIRLQLPGLLSQEVQFDVLGLSAEDGPYLLNRMGAIVQAGHALEPGANGLLLSQDVARMLDLEVGDRYAATSFEFYPGMDAPPEPTTFELAGILESDVQLGIVSLEFLARQPQYRHFPARLLVVAREGRDAAVDAFLRDDVQSPQTAVLTLGTLNDRIVAEALPGLVMLLPVVLIVGLAFSLVLVVVNQIASAHRLSEFGILHAAGYRRRWLARRLTRETTTLALAGWLLGIGIAWAGLYALNVTYFSPRGHALSYPFWLPVLFALAIPAEIAGLTFLTVRRTLQRLDPVAIVERRELSQESGSGLRRPGATSAPNPLAPATFYARHRRRAVLLVGAMSVMILAVVLFLFALAVGADAQEAFVGYLNRVSIVRSPGIVASLDPAILARVEAHPAVKRTIPVAPRSHMLSATIPPFTDPDASPFGVSAGDMAYLVELYDLELRDGRLPRPGTNEMVIPDTLARNRDLAVGDLIGDPDRPAYPGAPSLPTPFRISGIFAPPAAPEDGSGWGFVSLEFLQANEPFPLPEVLPQIVVPHAGQKAALDRWLESELAGPEASVLTHRQQMGRIRDKARQDMLSMALLEAVVAVVAALGLAVLNQIFTAQRHAEFGVLHALGHSRRQLVGRVLGETAFATGIAWSLAAVLCLAAILGLRFGVFAPLGLRFNLFDLSPWLYTPPIPAAVLAAASLSTARTLSRLDAVSVIERKAL